MEGPRIVLQFWVLGPLEVTDGDRLVPLDAPKERALLAILLIEPGRAMTSDRLIGLLWGDSPPEGAVGALRYHVSKLRDLLEPDRQGSQILVTRGGGYALEVAPEQIDAVRFESLVSEARTTDDPAASLTLLDEALGLWRGPAYADFEFEEFARGEIHRLEELRLLAEEHRQGALLGLGRHEEAVAALTALTTDHPLRERCWEMLMIGLYRSGRQAEALDAFRRARRILAEELGIEPSEELCRLEERILLQDPSLLYTKATPHNLPAPMSSFVGRESESAGFSELLVDHRLVTLTGPGGVGKSRLAVETARGLLARFPDGVWLVELASLDDPDLVAQAVAASVGLTDRRWAASATDRLVGALRGRTMLLILDNCEHLVDPVAVFADILLTRLPQMRIVATSREPLRVSGEMIFPVEPLPFPDPAVSVESSRDFAAVELFHQRASAAAPAFRLTADNATDVARLCERLDGLPLALELAAAHARLLSPGQIIDRLERGSGLLTARSRRVATRHRSLEAAIAWTYDTLGSVERTLFERLSAFSGGFGLEAAEAVCALEPIGRSDILWLLGELVDASLVVATPTAAGEVRYRLLESLRAFARDRLNSSGETGVLRERHARYFREWAAARGAPLHWPQNEAEMQGWRLEVDNLRSALTWALDTGDADTALAITGAMWRFWNLDGASAEGLSWLERSLAIAGPGGGLAVIVALRGAGALCSALGRVEEAQLHDMRAIALAAGDPSEEAQLQLVSVLGNLGDKRMYLGDHPGAAALFEEAWRIGSPIDHPHLGVLSFEIGWNALCLDDFPRAHALFTGGSADHQTFGHPLLWGDGIVRWIEGDLIASRTILDAFLAGGGELQQVRSDAGILAALVARDEHHLDLAMKELTNCLPAILAAGSGHLCAPAMLAWWLMVAATVHAHHGHPELVARLAGAVAHALEDSDWVVPGFIQRDFDRHVGRVRAEMDPDDFERSRKAGYTVTTDAACLDALRNTGD